MKKGFFAYSSEPKYCGEAIEKAIEIINDGKTTYIKPWTKLKIGGKLVISEILEEIDASDYFCADLTGINDNVLFELGYAIGKDKPIWVIFDKTYLPSGKLYKEISFLEIIGHKPYTNHENIIKHFYEEQPNNSSNTFLSQLRKTIRDINYSEPILLLKSQIDTDYSRAIISALRESKLTSIIDDAVESKTQSLAWYLERLLKIPGLIAEFCPTTKFGYEIQNSKCAFVSGLALGLGLEILMVSEEPYESPIDYKNLFQKYSNTLECRRILFDFLNPFKEEVFELISKRIKYSKALHERSSLQKINFGESQAEFEENNLYDYYVETASSEDLIKSGYSIVIGRKGVGKTAALYFLKEELSDNPKNHVCVIRPVSFELGALLYIIEKAPESFEKSYLIESSWKFLIYTEIAKTIYERLISKPLYAVQVDERKFMNFVEGKKQIILKDFSIRLEEQLKDIESISVEKNIADFKIKVSELLHEDILRTIRELLMGIFSENKIIVLIDDLDKNWRKESKLDLQSKWILGLLSVASNIAKDFSKSRSGQKRIDFSLTIFLRSDIFKYVWESAREKDKIKYRKLLMNDSEVLFRIIEERFVQLNRDEVIPTDLWDKYIVKEIDNQPVKEYILERIIPRPRDMIYFFKKAKESATLRGHAIITDADIKSAYKEYSGWFFTALKVENGVTLEQMSDFLFELMGCSEIVDREYLIGAMRKTKIKGEEDFIDHLASLSIIGRETKADKFEYEYDFNEGEKLRALASKLTSNRFKIHSALVSYLECVK
jgi:hypothetical protein